MSAQSKVDLENFAKIPEPLRENMGFLTDIKKPMEYSPLQEGCNPGENYDCLKNGVELTGCFPGVETAFVSLQNVLQAKGIIEVKGGYPLRFLRDESFKHEEYKLTSNATGCEISAADADGMRRAIYFLEDRINEAAGASVSAGEWKRKPFVKHRISRCFLVLLTGRPFLLMS